MADGDIPELGIRISGDASSAQAAVKGTTQSVNELAQAADRAQGPINTLGNVHGSAFGKIVTGSRAASGAMRGFIEASRGGIFTIGGLARAINDLFVVMRAAGGAAGPFALMALGIGVLIGVLRGLANHLGETHRALKSTADEGHRLKDALKAVEEESKKDLKNMEEQVTSLLTRYRELLAIMGEIEGRNREINSSMEKRDLARIDVSEAKELAGATTPEDKERIQAKYEAQRGITKSRYRGIEIENEALAAGVHESNAGNFLTNVGAQRLGLLGDVNAKAGAAEDAKGIALATARKLLSQPDINSTTIGLPVPFHGTSMEVGGDPTKNNLMKALSEQTVAATALRISAENAAKALDEFDKKTRAEVDAAQRQIDDARAMRTKTGIDAETNSLEAQLSLIRSGTKGADAGARGDARSNAEVLQLEQEMLRAMEGVLPTRTIKDYAGGRSAKTTKETIYDAPARALIRDIEARRAKIAQGKGGENAATDELINAVHSLIITMDGKVDTLNTKALEKIRTLEAQIKNSTRGN